MRRLTARNVITISLYCILCMKLAFPIVATIVSTCTIHAADQMNASILHAYYVRFSARTTRKWISTAHIVSKSQMNYVARKMHPSACHRKARTWIECIGAKELLRRFHQICCGKLKEKYTHNSVKWNVRSLKANLYHVMPKFSVIHTPFNDSSLDSWIPPCIFFQIKYLSPLCHAKTVSFSLKRQLGTMQISAGQIGNKLHLRWIFQSSIGWKGYLIIWQQ